MNSDNKSDLSCMKIRVGWFFKSEEWIRVVAFFWLECTYDSGHFTRRCKARRVYVVSIKKLSFMYGVTMGVYLFAWFYQHWKCYQRSTGTQVLPVFRALFNGVYVFSLFSRIQQALDVSGRTYQWFPTRRAALLGIAWALPIISMMIEGDEPSFWIFILLNWGLFVACGWLLIGAQRAVNYLHNDPQGKKNRTLNVANRVWAVCGAVVWMVFILMMMLLVYVPY